MSQYKAGKIWSAVAALDRHCFDFFSAEWADFCVWFHDMSLRVLGITAIKKTQFRYSVTQEALTSPTTTKHENASIIIDTYHAEGRRLKNCQFSCVAYII